MKDFVLISGWIIWSFFELCYYAYKENKLRFKLFFSYSAGVLVGYVFKMITK